MTGLRIALVVQGRFHAFDLARALDARGHAVTILTNYPAWAAARFGVGGARVRSAAWHGAAVRAIDRVPPAWRPRSADAWTHQAFGRWAASVLERDRWDVIHSWSSISEELLASPRIRARSRLLMRGSAHIDTQDAILRDEEARTGARLERPTPWMIARERREYARADGVVVLSTFARRSFEAQGYAPERLAVVPLGVDVRTFRPSPETIAARASRIRRGDRLRAVYVGALALQKGLWDLAEISKLVADLPIDIQLVGPLTHDAAVALSRMSPSVRHVGAVPQAELPRIYADADVFVFPTLQDGFGMVLTQAKAAGLPILCTDHCAGPDLIEDGRDGWIFGIRAPQAFAARLRWCHEHRDALADMACHVAERYTARDWSEVAGAFETAIEPFLHGEREVRSA